MNQRGSMNQRTDEIERILNASKVNYSSPQVSQQPTLYEVQRRYAEDLKQLRQQFEESQRKQEIKDREQAKEKQIDRLYDLLIDDLQNKCCNLNAKRQSQNPCCSPVVLAAGLFVVVHTVLPSLRYPVMVVLAVVLAYRCHAHAHPEQGQLVLRL